MVNRFRRIKNRLTLAARRFIFKLRHPGQKYKMTSSGEALIEYCVKVLTARSEVKPDGYSEFLANETLKRIAEEDGLSVMEAAYMVLDIALVSGAINSKEK